MGFISGAGQVYALGRKEYGRLGLGEDNLEEKSEPTPIETLQGKNVTQVAAGTATSFAIDSEGGFSFCGENVFLDF